MSEEDFYDHLASVVGGRWDEVIDYADGRGISLADAVHELINKGLSHA